MSWFMVIDGAGNAVSMGTVVADPLPAGLSAVSLADADADAILAGEKTWDAGTQSVVVVVPPVPEAVYPWQLCRWLLDHKGVDLDAIDAMIASIPDATDRKRAQIDWAKAQEFRRDHSLIASFAAGLGMDSAAVDQAFREAAALER